MSNEHLYLAMAVPSALAFLGIVTSLITFFISNSGLQKRLDQVQTSLDTRFKRMQNSIHLIQRGQKEFYAKQAVHNAEIANIKAQRQ